jgi:predicted MFS family arabinose efflux permease
MSGSARRNLFVGLVSFLTLVDLFAAQALLPSLTATFDASPALMSSAVNASTLGMAIAGLAVALAARRFDRPKAIWTCLLLLALPTLALSVTDDLLTFALLRIVQGCLMAAAFAFTMAHLSESLPAEQTAHALAAYVAGNVASNLFGRIIAAAAADHLGLGAAFVLFAAMNIIGALIVRSGLPALVPSPVRPGAAGMDAAAIGAALTDRRLAACYASGFLILFVFIGTFSYVNFVLASPPMNLSQMSIGWVYLVFVPALLVTPFAGGWVSQLGGQRVMFGGFGSAAVGLGLAAAPQLAALLTGLALIAVGLFVAQAAMTAQVSRLAGTNRAAASGLYLSSYYLGGLIGSLALGFVFDRAGWPGCVVFMLASVAVAAALTPVAGRVAPGLARRTAVAP